MGDESAGPLQEISSSEAQAILIRIITSRNMARRITDAGSKSKMLLSGVGGARSEAEDQDQTADDQNDDYSDNQLKIVSGRL